MEKQLDELLGFSKHAHKVCLECVLALSKQTLEKEINELIFVPMTILGTITRQQEAIERLLKSGYPSEAATIALSQFELRLDILFIGHDVKKATQWVEHELEHRQPWPTRNKIEHIYGVESPEASRQRQLYSFLSSIKHGNPKSGGFGFNVRGTEKGFTLSTTTVEDEFSLIFSCVLAAFSTHQLIEAVSSYHDLIKRYFGTPAEIEENIADIQKQSQLNMAEVFQLIEKAQGQCE